MPCRSSRGFFLESPRTGSLSEVLHRPCRRYAKFYTARCVSRSEPLRSQLYRAIPERQRKNSKDCGEKKANEPPRHEEHQAVLFRSTLNSEGNAVERRAEDNCL